MRVDPCPRCKRAGRDPADRRRKCPRCLGRGYVPSPRGPGGDIYGTFRFMHKQRERDRRRGRAWW